MQDWAHGYVADIDYSFGFYQELVPAHQFFACLTAGMRSPAPDARLTYCELGCGQGLSTNILAAGNPHIDFYATDFNPDHIAGAQRLADDAEIDNVHFYDCAFADFDAHPTLPDSFDVIALHGIYSWISPENRRHIVAFIRRKLRPGGLVYISYNTLPGWAAVMPLRRLLVDHAATRSGPITGRIDAALDFACQMKGVNARAFAANPVLGERLAAMQPMARNYLAHEYFNRDWTPFYFEDVVAELSAAKLSFVASAHLPDQLDLINLTDDQKTLLATEADPIRRQGLKDFMINQQFRRDIFVKGREAYSLPDSRAVWSRQRFVMSARPEDVPMTLKTPLGEMTLQEAVYKPLLEKLTEPSTLAALIEDPKIADLGWARLQQALVLLVGAGHLQLCLPEKDQRKRKERTNRLNKVLMARAQSSANIAYLASPVTSAGIMVNRFEQLFLASIANGQNRPEDWANSVWNILSSQGIRLQKEGAVIESDADNLAELNRQAQEFSEKRLKVLQNLQVI